MRQHNGIILLDSLFGIGIFLSTLFFATAELSYFLKMQTELNQQNKALLLAINTLNSLQQKQNSTDENLSSFEYEPGIRCYRYKSTPYHFNLLLEQ